MDPLKPASSGPFARAATARSAPAKAAAIPIVINAAAGLRRRDIVRRVEAALTAAGVEATLEAVSPHQLARVIGRSQEEGSTLIGVAGGDGTILTAAEQLAGSTVALAPLPIGTLNHFARRLGIPHLQGAAEALRRGSVATAPLGIVDDRVFLNTATFGFYADTVRRRERFRGALGKWPAALVAFAATLGRMRMLDVALTVDGKRLERRTALVWVGVGRGSFPLVHESEDRRRHPDLEIVVLRPRGVAGSAALILRMLLRLRRRGHPVNDPALEVLHAREVLIQGQHRIGVTLDGEVLRCEPPIFIGLQHEALRVVTGPDPERS